MESMTITNNYKEETKTNASRQDIISFYDEATEDYSFWSKDLNMHFGYFKLGKTNPFKRDAMLNELNNQLYNRLELNKAQNIVADLGCGMGGTIRHFLIKNPQLNMMGVTLSTFQVTEGNKLLKDKKGVILQENYCDTSIATNSMDGAVAVESFCHSGHSIEALEEAFRILKPGAKFILSDAFLKKDPENLCFGSAYSYKNLCKGWSLDGLGIIDIVEQILKKIGFEDVKVEDISFRSAPSVLHVPFAITGFLIKNIFQNKKIKPQSWNNLKASFYALLSGLHMRDFRYYIITATK
ncbi:MAG: methyltransferase domain-containing protein [Patiriisocius sp.]|uniref:SAM-dependent methyltransferase n=1 Tax=Patiriisocius sp. TaxID=2822396 RepID=UPI003EF54D5A